MSQSFPNHLTFSIEGISSCWNLCQQVSFEPIEKRLLSLLSQGYSVQQMSKSLNIPKSTLDKYLMRMREKLGARSTIHLLSIAFRGGLIS